MKAARAGFLGLIFVAFPACTAITGLPEVPNPVDAGDGGASSSRTGTDATTGEGSDSGDGSEASDVLDAPSSSDSTLGSDSTSGAGDSSSDSSSGAAGGSDASVDVEVLPCTIERGPTPTASSASAAGPYSTMSYAANASVRMTDAYDVTSAHIYYPVGATPPFAAVSIVPGYVGAESSIADWGPFLASWGIVVMTIGTSNPSTGGSDTSVEPPVREAALLDALTTIKGEQTRSGSPLEGMLDINRLGVAGSQMGGGGALLAANSTSSLKAVIAMEPYGPSTTYPDDSVPTLIFAGGSDTLEGPPMPEDQYMSIPSTTPKLLYLIANGGAFAAASPTNTTTDLVDAGTTANVARFGLSWLKVFLECDERFRPFLLTKPGDAEEFDSTLM
jgi:dienelactone hydrolase